MDATGTSRIACKQVLYEPREANAAFAQSFTFFLLPSYPALRAKCRVRLAWFIKRLLCRFESLNAHYQVTVWRKFANSGDVTC